MKTITVYQNEPQKQLGDLYGLFFEDINHAADGGLYAELVQNRSFEYDKIDRHEYHGFTAWEKSEGVEWCIAAEQPLHENNQRYASIKAQPGSYLRNLGYNQGIVTEEGKCYDFSVFLRGIVAGELLVSVVEPDGTACTDVQKISIEKTDWEKQECVLTAVRTTVTGRLQLQFTQHCELHLDMVSLFPQDTFLGKKGGLRRDIAEALQKMKPKFMRFPGGCLTHDGSLNDRFLFFLLLDFFFPQMKQDDSRLEQIPLQSFLGKHIKTCNWQLTACFQFQIH